MTDIDERPVNGHPTPPGESRLQPEPLHLTAANAPPGGALLDPDGGLTAGDETTPGQDVPDPGAPVEAHLMLVKPTPRQRLAALDGEDPVLPGWVRDRVIRREVLARARRRARRASVLAAIRAPQITALVVWWTVRGWAALTGRVLAWAWDKDGHPRYGHQPAQSDRAFDAMATHRAQRQQARFTLLAVAAVAALIAVMVAWFLATWVVYVLTAAVVGVLARVGKPAEVKLLSPGVRAHVVPRLTCELVARALSEVTGDKTARLIREHSDRLWQSGFVTVRGGHVIRVVLPGSALAADLVPHEQRLASAVGRPEDCVIVEPLPQITTGHFDLYLFDRPQLGGKPSPGPLASAKKTNWWEPVSCGRTRVGRPHMERIHGGAWFLGGKPESGKSSLGLIAAAHTALDPNALLLLVNLKGSPDYHPFKPICYRYISTTPELDPKVIADVAALVRWLLTETGRRNAFFTRLVEQGKATGSAVTEELSRRYPELRPMTVILDEIHRMFDKSDNPDAEGFAELLGKVLKACRSVAISVIGITQLAGTESIPGVVTRAARVRACLRVSESVSFRQIFGDAGQGVFNTLGIARFPQGTALLSAEDGSPVKVGCWYITPALAAIGKRALDLHRQFHTLAGEAAGEAVTTGAPIDPADLLRDLLPVIAGTAPTGGPDDTGVAWISELEATLTEQDTYRGRAPGWLATELRTRSVPVRQLNRRVPTEVRASGQRNESGLTALDVREALATLLSQ